MNDIERVKRPVTRSPNYPSIDLSRAIDRVRSLYKAERQHTMPALQAVRHWGYSSLNSPGGGQLAALARFGLLDDEGTKDERKVRVTDLAVRILEHPDLTERKTAMRRAALLPSVHQDMWQTYGAELPSGDNLKWFLTRDRGFSENGAKDFIKEYLATINFANLDTDLDEAVETLPSEVVSELAPTSAPAAMPVQSTSAPAPTSPAMMRVTGQTPPISFPLAGGNIVTVAGLSNLTDGDWAQFIAVLTALKPSLVRPVAVPRDADDGE